MNKPVTVTNPYCLICLYLVDPATFQASNSPYFLLVYWVQEKNKYRVCIITSLILIKLSTLSGFVSVHHFCPKQDIPQRVLCPCWLVSVHWCSPEAVFSQIFKHTWWVSMVLIRSFSVSTLNLSGQRSVSGEQARCQQGQDEVCKRHRGL